MDGSAIKLFFIENYLGGDHGTLYCPSANYRYNHTDHEHGDQYFGMFYLAGADPGFNNLGWRWFTWHNFQIVYTSNTCESPVSTPLMMDAAAVGGTWNRQEQASRPAFPPNNHETDSDYQMPAFENIVWQDGHVLGVADPPSKDQQTGNLHCGGHLRW
jgi:hypothetical protein